MDVDATAIAGWCRRALGAAPVAVEGLDGAMSHVLSARLDDGRTVVLKVRFDPAGRVPSCVEIQRRAAAAGFPCPRPLSAPGTVGGLAIHAEEWRPGGAVVGDDGVEAAARSAALLADLARILAEAVPIAGPAPLPNPPWVAWDHAGDGGWPPHGFIDRQPDRGPLPTVIAATAARVRARLGACTLPIVVGHADWEAQNLRWEDGPDGPRALVVHDWDSAAALPEAAICGAAAGAFASTDVPTLAPLASTAAFLEAYQERRGVAFTAEEREVAWAASLWPALHNARAEFRCALPPVAGAALAAQATARLRLARA